MLVVLPVAAALEHSRRLNDTLSRESEGLLAAGVEAVREGRRLRDQLLAIERLVRQYLVVSDAELLDLVTARRAEVDQALRWLRGADAGDSVGPSLDRIADGLDRIDSALFRPPYATATLESVVDGLGEVHAAARLADLAVQRTVDARMARLSERLERERRGLLRLTAAMLVLSLVLAAVFTSLIVRPIRQLGETLKRLGNGELESAVRVSGPAELARLAGELEWLRVRLQENDENRHDFLRLVSHELKTPLASLREGTSLLEEGRIGELTATQREVITILQSSVQRLDAQIRNVLAFSGLDQGVMVSEPRPCSLLECLTSTAQGLRLLLARRSVSLAMPQTDATAYVDPDQLRMILDNLLSNAIKHARTGGTIAVDVDAGARSVDIRVIDDGPGIPARDRERVFSPFFKSTSGERASAGTGIGLAVVRLCARANGGDVAIEAGQHAGTVVRVTLPSGARARAA